MVRRPRRSRRTISGCRSDHLSGDRKRRGDRLVLLHGNGSEQKHRHRGISDHHHPEARPRHRHRPELAGGRHRRDHVEPVARPPPDAAAATAAQLTYTVTGGPADGILLNTGTPVASFTQNDIDNGSISYQESGNAQNDAFGFVVTDPNGGTVTGSFPITIQGTTACDHHPGDRRLGRRRLSGRPAGP